MLVLLICAQKASSIRILPLYCSQIQKKETESSPTKHLPNSPPPKSRLLPDFCRSAPPQFPISLLSLARMGGAVSDGPGSDFAALEAAAGGGVVEAMEGGGEVDSRGEEGLVSLLFSYFSFLGGGGGISFLSVFLTFFLECCGLEG